MAKKLKVTQSDISQMENGTRRIGREVAKRIGELFCFNYKIVLRIKSLCFTTTQVDMSGVQPHAALAHGLEASHTDGFRLSATDHLLWSYSLNP